MSIYPKANPHSSPWMSDKLRIMLVDDHQLTRVGIRMLLESQHGMEVVGEASDGASAIALVDSCKPDVILMDVSMLGVDGVEATRQIKSRLKSSRIIMFSSRDDEEAVKRSIAFGTPRNSDSIVADTPMLKLEQMDIRQVLDKCRRELKQIADAKNIEIIEPSLAQPLLAYADAKAIGHVVSNLVQNAIKFSPNGSTIAIAAEQVNGRVKISVRDQGCGIGPEERKRLFQPFSQGARGKEVSSGTGLGLYLSREIVVACGGELTLVDDAGAGATFVIVLPAENKKARAQRNQG
ncbi:MAG TPA: ATP-binding protein [Candidatus Obscuribacterales bacterium]